MERSRGGQRWQQVGVVGSIRGLSPGALMLALVAMEEKCEAQEREREEVARHKQKEELAVMSRNAPPPELGERELEKAWRRLEERILKKWEKEKPSIESTFFLRDDGMSQSEILF
ncbi:hypothetical protein B0H19DRAFT_1061737 [Mycena capillaripes]|nr:hypothetical protein B0H19DRAFT_1061737 [Mycena capillaripes]